MTIELRIGLMREHRREDYITKIAGATIDRDCPIPLWTRFLDDIVPDEELQAYLQRVCGYCMTGVITEHALFFFYGTGANGKSVFLNTLRGIWGTYATTAPMEMFMESKTDRHPTELARLMGIRLVIAQEIERGQRWAESKIKALTGGDLITARFMRQDFFEFKPKFKLMIAGNHKPTLRGIDEAIRRRIHLIPLVVTIPPGKRDKELFEKLKPEWPGILAWCLDGCVEWQKLGLARQKPSSTPPNSTSRTRTASGNGSTRCNPDPAAETLSSVLYADWKEWTGANGLPAGSNKSLTQALIDREFGRKHTNKGAKIIGLALRPRD
jgi:P4 family phage/plasmid primase-like protien